jgi:hypothetical protein
MDSTVQAAWSTERILDQAAEAGFHIAKLAFDDPKRMFNLRLRVGFGFGFGFGFGYFNFAPVCA